MKKIISVLFALCLCMAASAQQHFLGTDVLYGLCILMLTIFKKTII